MIRLKDLENEDGKAIFEENRKAVERFVRSKVFSADVEDIVQEVCTRVLKKMNSNQNAEVNQGLFINVAKKVLLEHWRNEKKVKERFATPANEGESENEIPVDSDLSLRNFNDEKRRLVVNDCFMECFNELKLEQQILLWRYSFDEKKHQLDSEEPSAYQNFFGTIQDSIREIREKFLPMQGKYKPLDSDARLKVHRLREKLRICSQNYISRKNSN